MESYNQGVATMKKILVSGLINTETTVKIRKFPIEYYPVDYPSYNVKPQIIDF